MLQFTVRKEAAWLSGKSARLANWFTSCHTYTYTCTHTHTNFSWTKKGGTIYPYVKHQPKGWSQPGFILSVVVL